MGLLRDEVFQAQTISLRSGDTIVLPPDGIYETRSLELESCGQDRMLNHFAEQSQVSASDSLASLFEACKTFAGDACISDDMT